MSELNSDDLINQKIDLNLVEFDYQEKVCLNIEDQSDISDKKTIKKRENKESDIFDIVIDGLGLQYIIETRFVQVASTITGLQPKYLLSGLISTICILVVFNLAASIIVGSIGFFYPGYQSFKAIESKNSSNDEKRWLSYWVCYAIIVFIDYTLNFILLMVPFYYLLKLILIVYLMHPTLKGSVYVYDKIVQPVIKKYENIIDLQLMRLEEQIGLVTKQI